MRTRTVIIIVSLVIFLMFLLNIDANKAIEQCTNAGHDYNYCASALK